MRDAGSIRSGYPLAWSSVLLGTALVLSCDIERTPSEPRDANSVLSVSVTDYQIPQGTRDVPAVTISRRPTRDYAWLDNDAALTEAVESEGGVVVVGFKDSLSARVRDTGVRAAVSKEAIGQGVRLLEKLGSEIVHQYLAFGSAAARIDPRLAPQLREHPLVDYIEPETHGHIDGVAGKGSVASAYEILLTTVRGGQSVPWGISLTQFPSAWAANVAGAGAKVLIIDTGYDRGHEDLPLPSTANCGGSWDGCSDAFPFPHGTHVSGIVTARYNSVGVVGGARSVGNADFYSWGACDNQSADCFSTQVQAGLDSAISWGIDVVNMSFSLPPSTGLENAVAQAWAGDLVLVSTAGNGGIEFPQYPAL